MKIFLVLAAVVLVTQAASNLQIQEWAQFKLNYIKHYETKLEESYRFNIFADNKQRIEAHNARFEAGLETFKMSLNKFADWTNEEFVRKMNRFENIQKNGKKFIAKDDPLPDTKDWRNEGAVTPIKDQGQCGSCWAFSATGALEGAEFVTNGHLVSLSEQELVDCSVTDGGNEGCGGGLPDLAYEYVISAKGLDTEKAYPYRAVDGKCKRNESAIGTVATGYTDVDYGDVHGLQVAVATIAPISVGMDASHFSFQFYDGGIYTEPDCDPDGLDHGVLVVGYGREDNTDYWIVKNSWGTSWGEEGYFRIPRDNNYCGLASAASYPQVQKKN